jgi:hypothetical protein
VDKGAGNPDYYQKLVIPEVVEYTRGANIKKKIKAAMNRSQLYVGLFGNEYSEQSVDEFNDAIDRGMTTLVYYFTTPPAPLKSNPGTPNQPNPVYEFLLKEVYSRDILIRGNYSRIELKSEAELEDEIVIDILAELADMIRQYHNVQKAISGFES